jgi:methyl-accepting chemotaxis protein
VGDLARAFAAMIAAQQELAAAARRLAAGDLSTEVVMRSERDVLAGSMAGAIASLRSLTDETRVLTEAARDGNLQARGDASRFAGGYRAQLQGINDLLAAVAAPIGEARSVLERVAGRDLTAEMTGDYRGEYASIKTSLNAAVGNLVDAMGQVQVAAGQVAASSSQIASGSNSLAEGASEQAASLEEVSSSLTELASMAQQSAGNARHAGALVEDARTAAAAGASGMEQLSTAMEQIRTSTGQTAKIVKTIDEIAFQTNLLALNAAVEAARAGDAGRGFAVVAEEVRALALRAAEAAKQTSELIEGVGASVSHGVTLNGEVLASLAALNTQVAGVSTVMREITAANEQQSQGVVQISTAVEQMNAVTQHVASSAEESAAAAEELDGNARQMQETVGSFRLAAPLAASVVRKDASPGWSRPAAKRAARRPLATVGAAAFSGNDDALGEF